LEELADLNAPLPFRVPEGYTAERVAAAPLVKQPMFACFDDRGRLYVACSSGHNSSGNQLLKDAPDAIRCLEDTDGDGRFDRSTVFADRLTFPQGVLWHDGAVYTASPPSLWRLEDRDGDGVADRRTELLTGFPFTGIADDMHGPCLGPDGLLYWGVGRFDYAIRKPGGPLIHEGRTPIVMRCRPDGEEAEVFSAAMGNPVEVTFSPAGEPFACGTFLSPGTQGQGLRDALIHCVYGGLYPVRDRDLNGETRTGDLLPPLAQLGVAAASGVTRARGGPFGNDEHQVLYAAMFNLHSVSQFALERVGGTFRAREEPFLLSDEPDFHPTDVLEDADGSLLVVDTGGWFRSCPTSQITKPRIRGAIYRVRRIESKPASDARGLTIRWDTEAPRDLAKRLDDPRVAVRDQAVTRLAALGEAALPALRELLKSGASRARLQAVWVLARIAGDGARAATRDALDDPEASVRLAAATAAGLHRDAKAARRLEEMIRTADLDMALQREAATALARLGRRESVPALLSGLRAHADRFVEHALIYALIRIDDADGTRTGLSQPDPAVRRGALIALDQMNQGGLTWADVKPLLDPALPDLRKAALQVTASHPEWAEAMSGTLRRWLFDGVDVAKQEELRQQLLAFATNQAVQFLFAEALVNGSTPAATRALVLQVMPSALPGEWPAVWDAAVRKALRDRDDAVVRQAVAVVAASDRFGFDAPLLDLAADPSRDADTRAQALDALAPRLSRLEPALFDFLTKRLDVEEPPLSRMTAARALGRAPLDDAQLLALTKAIGEAGSLILPRLFPAYERSGDQRVGIALLAALGRSRGIGGIDAASLRRTLTDYPDDVRREGELLVHQMESQGAEQVSRLTALAPLLAEGNALRGREVFFGSRAACSTCHTIRSEGGHVGPDLSKIGAARTGRDLLESILLPSASFARGFEPFVIATTDGRVHTGIVLRETIDAIVLMTLDRVEQPIPRSSVESIEPSRVSVMPQGLDANISSQELADLVAFLKSLH
jgi:putative membrane-bound dehydrogenase-like protein